AGARAADAHAFIGLDAGALALHHLDVHEHRVARLEFGNFLAGGKLCDLLLLELLNQVHGNSPSAAPILQALILAICAGRASFYDTAGVLSPFPTAPRVRPFLRLLRRVGRAGAGEMRGPQVRPARAGEPLGLGPAPSGNLGVVAGSEHIRDRATLPQL